MKNTRELLLEKAFFLMLEKGYKGISVSDIQSAVGLSRGVLYKHFSAKSELLMEACRHYFYEKFFPVNDDFKALSLRDFLELTNKNMSALCKIFAAAKNPKINILRYNLLYAEVMQNVPEFKSFIAGEMAAMSVVLKNALKRGEISKGLSEKFVGGVFYDIYCRASSAHGVGDKEIVSQIIKDSRGFYRLVAAKAQG